MSDIYVPSFGSFLSRFLHIFFNPIEDMDAKNDQKTIQKRCKSICIVMLVFV